MQPVLIYSLIVRAVFHLKVTLFARLWRMEHLNIFQVSNINTTLRFLKSKDFWVSAFDSEGGKEFNENKWDGKNVLLFGRRIWLKQKYSSKL